MNIPFTLADSTLDGEFSERRGSARHDATQRPPAVGGMRASIYNAMPIEGVKRLVEYMREFETKHG